METAAFREPRDGKLVGSGGAVGDIQPERDVSQSSVSTAGSEIENRNVEASSDVHRPPKEHVGDYTQRRLAVFFGDVGDQLAEGEFEGGGGLKQSDDLV